MRYATGLGILLIVFCSGRESNTARAITVQWSLAITDINEQTLTSPLTVGQTFWLDVDVADLRTIPNAGVLEGITDILFDPTKVAPTGNVMAGPDYPSPTAAPHMDLVAPNDMRVNGTVPINVNDPLLFDPPGTGPQLLDRIELRVIAPGTISFDTAMMIPESIFVADETGNVIGVADSEIGQATISTQAVPEPATIMLAIIALAGFAGRGLISPRSGHLFARISHL